MRVLVLGGTSFVGRTIVEEALRGGTELTLFSRGKSGTDLFPAVARRVGDRDTGDYAALRNGSWDAVIDVSGYVPRHVGQAMAVLGDRVGRYLLISGHAVYVRTGVGPGSDEDTPRRAPVRDTEELDEDTYGPLKVACEDDVMARYGARATIAAGQGSRAARSAGRSHVLGAPGRARQPGRGHARDSAGGHRGRRPRLGPRARRAAADARAVCRRRGETARRRHPGGPGWRGLDKRLSAGVTCGNREWFGSRLWGPAQSEPLRIKMSHFAGLGEMAPKCPGHWAAIGSAPGQ